MISLRRAAQVAAAGSALAGVAAVAAVAANPVVRDELRRARRLARPFGARDPLAPVPPLLPPARIVNLPGRGEVFARDTGDPPLVEPGPPVLLLHGWTVSADLNFFAVFETLAARHRVIALDHRGHGRGLRSEAPFSLEDCADDAAALLAELDIGPAIAAGFSMGGAIAMHLWARHRPAVAGLVFASTALEWSSSRRDRVVWRGMSLFEVALRNGTGDGIVERIMRELVEASPDLAPFEAWVMGEFHRHSPTDLAGAGRALAAYDGRPLAAGVDVPCAVVLTTADQMVPPDRQHRLAAALRAPVFEVHGDHLAPMTRRADFTAALAAAIDEVTARI